MKKSGRRRPEQSDPLKAAHAIAAYASTGSIRAAAKSAGVSRASVTEILKRNPQAFEEAQRTLAGHLLTLAEKAREHTEQRVEEMTGPQSAIVMGIAVDKANALLGRAPDAVNVQINIAQALQDNIKALATLQKRTPAT